MNTEGQNLSSTSSSSAPRVEPRLFGLGWAHFVNDGSANYLPGILPAVLVSLHEPVQAAGSLMAALLIGQALQPLMGWISDRLGGRSLIVIGLLGSSMGGALLGLANQVWVFVGLLFLIGIGNALFHPQALAAVRKLASRRQGLSTAIFLVGGELGRGIWPTIASVILEHFGLHALWVFAIPALLTAPFLVRLAPPVDARPRGGKPIHWNQHWGPLAILVGYAGLRAFITYGMITFIPILWNLHGGRLTTGATIITTMIVVGVAGNMAGGHLADRFGRRPILLISVTVAAILAPIVAHAHGAFIWISAGLIGIALFLAASTTVLIGQDIFPENRSLGSGIALGLANGVGAALVFVVGFWVNSDNVLPIFWVLFAAGLLSGLCALMFPRHLLRQQAAS